MPAPIRFEILGEDARSGARLGRVHTPHGSFETPAFMPVGTRGSVKGIIPPMVRASGAQILLNNTYHLMLRPGSSLIASLGGVHRFMGWDGPILTDSGGYQAYSMADLNAIDDEGVTFRSIVDGSRIRLTPERAMEVQNELGADIIMAFDDCPPSADPEREGTNQARLRHAAARDATGAGYDHDARLDLALDRTARWLERCRRHHARAHDQALFGIVQGGTDLGRRERSIEQVCSVDLPGYAIGGVAVGESGEQIARVVRFCGPRLPRNRPRYLMGVGYERDLVSAVLSGCDMFDCVLPTRNGRNANAFTRTGQVRLRNRACAEDPSPIEAGCDCPACSPAGHGWSTPDDLPISRAYLRHLFMSSEMLGPILVTLHNLRHFQRFMGDVRAAIGSGDWGALARDWPVAAGAIADWFEGDIPGQGDISPARSNNA